MEIILVLMVVEMNIFGEGIVMKGFFQFLVVVEFFVLVNILIIDFWVWEYYVVDDKVICLANKGCWFKLFVDGIYEMGCWEDKIGYGFWCLLNQDGKKILQFDNIDDCQDE